ncbi:SPOR domain-containing protein [Ramlibacter tataouinensis]|uniref:SPOR domain-containing protein n=1 Tax=Ramlibacter tataouinensis (strain ATCC BAA-407 / DSM 14655 / LMG 21543 / TTB310) TaxID=365046 RepID=F5Y2Y5_RAMTT|nr:SPOR domain-containing protein [Ramlibacter tataouinensis]AEG94865.1 conserved hypothetical protein [Ramlibacter tataouinensis TTB310]
MLRFVVLLLLLANVAYYAWSEGRLQSWGLAPAQQSEPQRLEQQIRPDAVRIVSAEDLARLETVVVIARPSECLQAGPLDDALAGTLRPALAAWPAGSWSLDPAIEPGRWIVYMGRYPAPDGVERKKAELRQLGVSFEPLANQALEPGLSLGGYGTQAAAERALDLLARRGVRTARVVQERPELNGVALRLPAVDELLRPRLDELRTTLGGATLRPCR